MSADLPPGELRYGLMISDLQVTRWQESVISSLDDVAGVSLSVIVLERRASAPSVRSPEIRRTGGLLWEAFDRRSRNRTPAFAMVDMSHRFAGVPMIEATVGRAPGRSELSEQDLEAVAAIRPDFLLRFGSGPIGGDVLDVAPLGVWSFRHSDRHVDGGGAPCYWECHHGEDTTDVLLERLTARAEGSIPLARARFRTIKHSVAANRHQAYMGAAQLPAQSARRVLAGVRDLSDGPIGSAPSPTGLVPNNAQVLRFMVRAVRRFVRLQLRSIAVAERWQVGILHRAIDAVVAEPVVSDATWFPGLSQSTRYIADPFGCPTQGGEFCVLVEEFDHVDGHGVVASYRVAPDGTVRSGPSPVKRFPTHVSYPSLVRVGAQWWMIPESARADEVKAYLFDPDTATITGEAATLVTGLALRDPTVFEWQGLWWLFATDGAMGSNTHLRAWWAESPTGPWRLHAIDPLCIDVRSARGAGTPFEIDGSLYRPGQDNSVSYGGAVTVKRVLELTPDRFREEWVCTLAPEPDGPFPDGLHTLNSLGGDLTLIDAVERRFDRAHAARNLSKRLHRLLRGKSDT